MINNQDSAGELKDTTAAGAQDAQNQTVKTTDQPQQDAAIENQDEYSPKARDHVRKLNAEAKRWREKYETIEKQLNDFSAAEKKREEERLAKQGEYETLYKKAQEEIDTLRPKLAELEKLARDVEARQKSELESLLKLATESEIEALEGKTVAGKIDWIKKHKLKFESSEPRPTTGSADEAATLIQTKEGYAQQLAKENPALYRAAVRIIAQGGQKK